MLTGNDVGAMRRNDTGAYAILYALMVVVVVMTAGIVVDISGMREDHRAEKLAADAAATAGAIKLNTLNGTANANEACEEAWRFLKVNLVDASAATANCPAATFPALVTSCPAAARTASGPAGPWQITITWPVHDTDSLMTAPPITGRDTYTQSIDADIDGSDPCGRLGVTVARNREFAFASIGGFVNAETVNSSVARAELKGQVSQEFPLVVLDQHGCDAMLASGSAIQDSTIRVLNNGITPGRIAMDSAADEPGNSSPGCANGNSYVANTNGGGRIVALNGSSGAPALMLAFAQPLTKSADPSDLCPAGVNPVSVATGICPRPVRYTQVTRKFWDWQYHCTAATFLPLSAPCPYTATVPDHIGALQGSLGTMTAANAAGRGFTVWPVTANDPSVCDYTGSQFRYVEPGNYYINCSAFNVNKVTIFGGGTLVFRGGAKSSDGIGVAGSGAGPSCLVLNQPVGAGLPPQADGSYAPCQPTSAEVTPEPNADMIVYIQKGSLSRQNADFIAPQTFIYHEADPSRGGTWTSRIDLGAGTSGNLLVTGPKAGVFENLAIWSENKAGVDLSGSQKQPNQLGSQNKLALEGILFLPNGKVEFGGDPLYLGSARAQFVAWRLAVFGGGTLELLPDAERTLTIPIGGVRLIR